MKNNLKISVITPSYNSGDYIERAIKSVLLQDYTNWEHIIIDGNSSDNTINIIKKYKHLKWISEKDNGQADAMNKGFKKSEGDIIVYLNADDYFFEGAFSAVIKKFELGSKFVVGNVLVKSSRLNSEFLNIPKTTLNEMLRHWEPNSFCHNPVGYFYLREVQEKCPFNMDNYATMDLEFLLDAASKYKFDKVDFTLGCFEDSKNTKTGKTQSRLDYWQNANFPYLTKYKKRMKLDDRIKYEKDQCNGYVKMQDHMNNLNKSYDNLSSFKSNDNPIVSVIIPNYNCEKYICRAIDSVLEQKKIKNIEIIVVDDASTDDSVKKITKKYSNNQNVKIFVHKENKKLGETRNTGLSNATGKYIFFLDSDDWINDECIFHLTSIAEQYKAEIVACGVNKVFADGKKIFYHGYSFACSGGVEGINYFSEYKIGSIAWNKLYLREFIENNNLRFIDRHWHEDVIFTTKCVFLCNNYVSIKKTYYNYFQRNNSIINQKQTVLHLESYIRLYFEFLNFFNKYIHQFTEYEKKMYIKLINAHCVIFIMNKFIEYRQKCESDNKFEEDVVTASFNVCGQKKGIVIASLIIRLCNRNYKKQVFCDNFDIKQSKTFRLGDLFFRSVKKPYKLITYPYNFVKILLEK